MNRLSTMRRCSRWLALLLLLTGTAPGLRGSDAVQVASLAPAAAPAGIADEYFVNEVWTKVAAQSCLECHKEGGDAEDSKLILRDPAKDPAGRHASLHYNRAALSRMALKQNKEQSRLLLKVVGGLDHGGEDVVKPDSTEYRILEEFTRRVKSGQAAPAVAASPAGRTADFFAGVTMVDDRRLLRRLTLSLAGRLPSAAESAAVERDGTKALREILDRVMEEDAFYERLAEAFNDIFLVRGYGDGAESALSYDHFSKTRHWTQKHDLDHIEDEKARQQARYKISDYYREALLREPLELVKHIVREDRPFTEILTADYIMMSPYTARGYGMFEELRERFLNTEDAFEYIPVRLKALKGRDKRQDQKSETGFYPHAGILSTFQYLRRYPTTETNRNRLRGRMFYQHFLGVDVLELAARVTDAAAASAKYEVPTMQAAECVVCHRTLDPVSSIFQDYYHFEGVFGPRKDGWFKDMFVAGFEGDDLPEEQRWRSIQWLAEKTVRDPRFARTMVEHVYYVLTGRRPLLPPKGIDDPLYDAKQRAHEAQRQEIERIASGFVKANYNLKEAFQQWAVSPFYRADGLATTAVDPKRRAELEDLGVARMLGPEQLERKIEAIFGKRWGRLRDSQFAMLYGGIDSEEVTERAADPSGAMGAIQRIMANDVACRNVAKDFAREPSQRRLFPNIEPDVVPGGSAGDDNRIREAIVNLHDVVLGRREAIDSPEVARAHALFAGIVQDAKDRKGVEAVESYFCRSSGEGRDKDPHYTIRAWRGVVTYLLRQREFLYE